MLTKLFNPTTGGHLRAIVAVVLAVGTFALAAVNTVDWSAGIVASIPALLQLVTHYTPIGNTPKT